MDPTFRLAEEKGYHLINLLGVGRFGKVYRGEHKQQTYGGVFASMHAWGRATDPPLFALPPPCCTTARWKFLHLSPAPLHVGSFRLSPFPAC